MRARIFRRICDRWRIIPKVCASFSSRRWPGGCEKGVSDGDLPAETNIKELAAYFDTIFRGLAVRARDGASRKQLLAICRVAMRAWPSRPPYSNHKTDHKGRPRGGIS